MVDQALKHYGTPVEKQGTLWTLRQLCARQETLPRSCILPIEFRTPGPHHAAGGFADVWKGTYGGREVAFKSVRTDTPADGVTRLKRRVCGMSHVALSSNPSPSLT